MDFQHAVLMFHKKYGAYVGAKETMPPSVQALRTRLIVEEAAEFVQACHENNFELMLDACADLLYVTFGTFVSMGVDARPVFAEVHRSNMTKQPLDSHGKGGKTRKGGSYEAPRIWDAVMGKIQWCENCPVWHPKSPPGTEFKDLCDYEQYELDEERI